MFKPLFLIRIALAIVGAFVMTSCVLALLMWLNGFMEEEGGSQISYTTCVFGSQKPQRIIDPYAEQRLSMDCIRPEDARPLYLKWFDTILGTRE
jgi:hypothetical protein